MRSQIGRQPEIHELDRAACGQQNVRGLDVPVHRPLRMGIRQAIADLGGNRHGLGNRQRRGFAQDFLQIAPPDIFHINDDTPADLIHAVDLHDVRVTQAVQNAGFFQKPLFLLTLGADFLQRDLLAQQRVFGEVNDARRPMSQHIQALIFSQPFQRHLFLSW